MTHLRHAVLTREPGGEPWDRLARLDSKLDRAFQNSEAGGQRQPGQQGFGLNTTNESRVVIFGGGIPIRRDGAVIGAVGASGGSVEQDVSVARAATLGFTS